MNNKDSRIPVDLNILKEISVVAINCLNIEPEKRQNMSAILRRDTKITSRFITTKK